VTNQEAGKNTVAAEEARLTPEAIAMLKLSRNRHADGFRAKPIRVSGRAVRRDVRTSTARSIKRLQRPTEGHRLLKVHSASR
jgi:hypothetical protein